MLSLFVKYVTLFMFIILLVPSKNAIAIPAFARKYKFSCSTCHIAIPKLKAYGNEFAGNGFLLPDGEEPKRAYVTTGDETLTLMRELPLAVRFDAYIQAANRDKAKVDLEVPFGIKLMSGGPISKKVSYYFYFYISERGEVAGVEDALLFFNDIGGIPLDMAVGQFQVSDPLYKRELRLTFEDYQIYRIRQGNSLANLIYDRGIALSYGFNSGLDLTAMLVNGNGIKAAGDDHIFDFDTNKSYALRAMQNLGMFNIGAFVYAGRETLQDSVKVSNNIFIFGPDISMGEDNWEFNVQYLIREGDTPYFLPANPTKLKSQGGFAEFTFMPNADQSLFLYTLLYNYIDSEEVGLDYNTLTFSVSHMAARNIRFLAEFTHDFISEKPRLALGIVTAF